MSLLRVFESARKMGVPVIVTDLAGQDPLVVVPLEQFEALTSEIRPANESVAPKAPPAREVPVQTVAPEQVQVPEVQSSAKPESTEPAQAQPVQKTEANAVHPAQSAVQEPIRSFQKIVEELEENPLEERFYLEPLDEGIGG